MGGEETGCSAETTDVLIESALWSPLNIAQTGRKLGINSDARYRFERGVDPNFMVPGLEQATQMVLDFCGGTPSEITVAGSTHAEDRIIEFPVAEVKRLSGLDVPLLEMKRVLGHLGFFVAGAGETVKVAIPSWRPDIEGKADIVEEVVRIVGVDTVPPTPFERGEDARKPILTSLQVRNRRAKRALAGRAMVEAVTWSFIGRSQAELFGGGQAELALANPIAADLSDMRPSLIPGLVTSAQKNADRGFPDVALFEVGQVFRGDRPEDQLTAASGVRRALAKPSGIGRHWQGNGEADAFDVKADALAVLVAAGAPRAGACRSCRAGPSWLHPGRSRHDPDRAAERARLFRRAASARARCARCRRPADGVRGDSRTHPRAEGEADARQAGAGALGVPAGDARLRVRGGCEGEGWRSRARGAERRHAS